MEVEIHRKLRAAGIVLACLLAGSAVAHAQASAAIAASYEAAARRESPGFSGFSANRGDAFFHSAHGSEWSCATCHTANPVAPGKHAKTGKAIAPLAPAANPERFTSLAITDKWFRRNCNDVVGRECTAQEKGDVLAYLVQLKP